MNGSCLCGAVRFRVTAIPHRPSICHCGQCRRQSGHAWASAQVGSAGIEIEGEVRWFASSPAVRRGFCPECGSVLFWKRDDEDRISFSLGSIDGPTGLRVERHIFVADKGDYYEIADGIAPS